MYFLNNLEIGGFDLGRAPEFVRCWERFYGYSVKVLAGTQDINYFDELNLSGDLSDENLRRLLRWKDPHRLTEVILSGANKGKRNEMVGRAIDSLPMLNRFRRGEVDEAAVRTAISAVFRTRVIFQGFLLHVAKPHVYPIADQHVLRVYALHNGVTAPATWDTYCAYRIYFFSIVQALGVPQTQEAVQDLKRVDNALMAFGQFLKKYHRPSKDAEHAAAPGRHSRLRCLLPASERRR